MFSRYLYFKRIILSLKNRKISIFALIDKKSEISLKAKINRFAKIRNTIVKDFSYIGPGSDFNNSEIGKFCSISGNVTVGLPTHPTNFISTSPIFFSPNNGTGTTWSNKKTFNDQPERTIIGNDVWIGINSIIMGGIKIGNGAIVAAGSIVTKDVPDYTIVGGVPAKVIRKRFDHETIANLTKSKWWDKPDYLLKQNIELFNNALNQENLTELIKKLS